MSDDRSMEDAVSSPNTEITALAQQVATARGKLPLQHDTALYDALSDSEIRAERELAEWIRAQRRKQRRRAVADELAAEQRDRRTGRLIRRTDEADARWHRKALAARRRVSSADARLAQLYRRAEWSSRALIGVVVLGMVWAGVNVQHNLVPSGDMSDPLYWLSFGIEAMISIPIITIMVAATTAARWGRELERGKVLVFELALLGTTVALNAGPHLASGSFGRAAEYSIAPVMVGVVIWLHAWVSARYALLIEGASVELPGDASYSPAERVVSEARASVTGLAGAEIEAARRVSTNSIAGVGGSSAMQPSASTMRSAAPQAAAPEQPVAQADPAAVETKAADPVAAARHIGQSVVADVRTEVVVSERAASGEAGSPAGEFESQTAALAATAPIRSATEDFATTVPTHVLAPSATDAAGTEAESRAVSSEHIAAQASTMSAQPETAAGWSQPTHGVRRPSTDKSTAPGTLELIHKAAADHRRNGVDHARVNGATPALRRIPVTAAAQATAGEATGTDPVPEATAHAGTVARDRNGDTAASTESVVVHNDPQPPADEPEQLTLTAELEPAPERLAPTGAGPAPKQQLPDLDPTPSAKQHLPNVESAHATKQQDPEPTPAAKQQLANPESAPVAKQQRTIRESATAPKQQLTRTEPTPATEQQLTQPEPTATPKKQLTKVEAASAEDMSPASDRVPVQSPEPIEPDVDDEDDLATDDYDFDDDTEVRALARQIAHRSPLRLTLDQIEEILELTDQSWSARSIGAEVGVSGSTVTNIVEFARKIRQPYAFTG
ncbi:hypothetical protein ACFVAV_19425 [Nocardia sp. NPDC057663]|uniref:helix-turn-helix domain-containing protein n=1 Tax=Nocardia sp. NPDC057663 TaxID=3346201 RepID=UPI00366CC86F